MSLTKKLIVTTLIAMGFLVSIRHGAGDTEFMGGLFAAICGIVIGVHWQLQVEAERRGRESGERKEQA